MTGAVASVLLLGIIGSGLLGGLFFAFSNFIMRALDRLPPAQAIAAMQAINITVLNPIFFLAFFGTGAISIALALLALFQWPNPAAPIMLAGALAYLIGAILVTLVFNVPLNNRLAKTRPAAEEPRSSWQAYAIAWTRWNHVRTVASLTATAAFSVCLWL